MSQQDNIKGRLRRYSRSDKTVNPLSGSPPLQLTRSTEKSVKTDANKQRLESLEVRSEPRKGLHKYKYTPRNSKTPTPLDSDSVKEDTLESFLEETSMMDTKEVAKLPPPEKITAKQWMEMYQKMNSTLLYIQSKMDKNEGTESVAFSSSTEQWFQSIEEGASQVETKLNVMIDIMVAQSRRIDDLEEKNKMLERYKGQNKVRISGLVQDKDETKTQLKEKVADFFKTQLEIQEEIPCADVYRIGPRSQRDRVVKIKLKNMEDKSTIFSNASNLKGKENVRRKLFYVDDEMDPEKAEQRKQLRFLQKQNKEQDQKLKIQMRKDELVVNNTVVSKKVHSPTIVELLKLTDERRDIVMNTKLIATDEHHEQGSEYYTFVQKVKTFGEVQNGLCKLRLRFGDATHVSCAYRLENAVGPFNQEGHDDKEYGAGRAVLKVLQNQQIRNLCVYVVRYFGGIKLGPRRFKILQMLTESAIGTYTFKARERRSRMFRSESQDSILSVISAISFDNKEEDDQASIASLDQDQTRAEETQENQQLNEPNEASQEVK